LGKQIKADQKKSPVGKQREGDGVAPGYQCGGVPTP